MMYQRLVPHKEVPCWECKSIRGIAYLPHFYTLAQGGNERDEFEKWLNNEIETPAKSVIDKIKSGSDISDITKDELLALLRFTSVQMVRTPAHYFNSSAQWIHEIQKCLSEFTGNSLVAAQKTKTAQKDDYTLIKHSVINRDDEKAYVEYKTVVGRTTHLSQIQRSANEWIPYFEKQKWHVIEAADGIEWPTSDDPVIRYRAVNDKEYTFAAGIAQKGTEVLFPLSPKHLLYASIDRKQPVDKMQKHYIFSELVRRTILEHSFLYVYSKSRQKGMFQYCPRTIDEVEFKRITQLYQNWHKLHSAFEAEY